MVTRAQVTTWSGPKVTWLGGYIYKGHKVTALKNLDKERDENNKMPSRQVKSRIKRSRLLFKE